MINKNKINQLRFNQRKAGHKFLITMYLYVLENDIENLELYIEHNFVKNNNITMDEIPLEIISLRGQDIRKKAYSFIGKRPD